jgi:hypothetical protein
MAGLAMRPPVGSIRSAILVAKGSHHAPAAPHRDVSDPDNGLENPDVSSADGLASLIELARTNPGLKITLSF